MEELLTKLLWPAILSGVTIAISWGVAKTTIRFLKKRVGALETWKTQVEKDEREKIDRLGRIETKLDLLITGKIKEGG